MTRCSSSVERPILHLLLLALMGLALASRLALGATLPVAGDIDGAKAAAPLAELQAAMITCHADHGHEPPPTTPQGPLLSDLLLLDQADNANALPSDAVSPSPMAGRWSAAEFLAVHATSRPPLGRPIHQARGPPATV